jgi:thymidylate kinase
MAQAEPARFRVIDASRSIEEVWLDIKGIAEKEILR